MNYKLLQGSLIVPSSVVNKGLPVGGEQRVFHHLTQQHSICAVFDASHTLHTLPHALPHFFYCGCMLMQSLQHVTVSERLNRTPEPIA